MLTWNGVSYSPGVVIPEEMYEDLIDRAYGSGMNLRDTLIWNDRYERGFALPDGRGMWDALVFDGRRHRYLGRFVKEQLVSDKEDWEDRESEMLLKADVSRPRDAIAILRDLYLDPRSGNRPTGKERMIADDADCIRWFVDYWTFVRWNERGNECAVSEVGFDGFADMILHPSQVSEYLKANDCDKSRDLIRRLSVLNKRYSNGRAR